ncbi:hypothetical protein L228DRAFT_270421 [Xylona heveae TC161]|uniref:Uncharacterized protein n=1 Tax=Xylona heveae (strain CBS 132557 / TC161) TaxID=1328760 RepID=A0A165AEH0_XYLHT|nr:hypothetical protein L228DRAFT_270421 [Xylona heveae TC161]KZF20344.1 hypothetical protein L228DRAFT_270421 [Xylona heveae TC161]
MTRRFRSGRTVSDAASSIRRVFGDLSNRSFSRRTASSQKPEKPKTETLSVNSGKFKWLSIFRKRKSTPEPGNNNSNDTPPTSGNLPGLTQAVVLQTPPVPPPQAGPRFMIYVDDDLSQSISASSAKSADVDANIKRRTDDNMNPALKTPRRAMNIQDYSGTEESNEGVARVHGVSIPNRDGPQAFFNTQTIQYNLAGWYPQTSELENDTLYTSDALEHLDASTTWPGLPYSYAEELLSWEVLFKECIARLINKQSTLHSTYPLFPEWAHKEILRVDVAQLVRDMVSASQAQGYDLRWLGRNGNLQGTLIHLVRTWSCFTGIDPRLWPTGLFAGSEDFPLKVSEKLIEVSHLESDHGREIEVAWAPDSVFFENLQVATREGDRFTLIPRYWCAFNSSLVEQDEFIKITFALEPSINWLRWNTEIQGFEGFVPLFSEFDQLPPGWKETVSKFETAGRDSHVHVLRIGVTATLSESFPANTICQQTIRVCLRISVAPWYTDTQGHCVTSWTPAVEEVDTLVNPMELNQICEEMNEEENLEFLEPFGQNNQSLEDGRLTNTWLESASNALESSNKFAIEDSHGLARNDFSETFSSPDSLTDYNVMAILKAHKMEGYGTEPLESSPRNSIDDYFGLVNDKTPEPKCIYAESIDFETLTPLAAESINLETNNTYCATPEQIDEASDEQIVKSPFARYFISLIEAVGPVEAEAASNVLEPQMVEVRKRILQLYSSSQTDTLNEKASEYQAILKAHKSSYLTRWMHSVRPSDTRVFRDDLTEDESSVEESSKEDDLCSEGNSISPTSVRAPPYTVVPSLKNKNRMERLDTPPMTPPLEVDSSLARSDSFFDGVYSFQEGDGAGRAPCDPSSSRTKVPSRASVHVSELILCAKAPTDSPARFSKEDRLDEQTNILEDYLAMLAQKEEDISPRVDKEEQEIFESIFMTEDDDDEEEY